MDITINKKAEKIIKKYLPFADTLHRGNYENAKKCALIEIKNTIAVLNKIYKKTPFLSDCEEYTADKIKEYTAIYNEIKKL